MILPKSLSQFYFFYHNKRFFPFNLLLLLRQVVKYDVHGHYHCHHDSDDVDPSLPCCTFSTEENCRLCRSVDLFAILLDGVDSLSEVQNEF